MKVVCINSKNYKNPFFDGPRPQEGDIVTVVSNEIFGGLYYYQLAEYPAENRYAAWRFATLPDEPAEVIEEQQLDHATA